MQAVKNGSGDNEIPGTSFSITHFRHRLTGDFPTAKDNLQDILFKHD